MMKKRQAAQCTIWPYHWDTEVQNRALNSCSLRHVPPVSKSWMSFFQNVPGSGSCTDICGFSLQHQTWRPHLIIQVRRWVGPDWSHFVSLALTMRLQDTQVQRQSSARLYRCSAAVCFLPSWEGPGVRALSPVAYAAATVQRQCSGGSR